MVEGARLERVCASNRTQGSNPCLSAKYTAEIKSAAQRGRRFQLSDTNLYHNNHHDPGSYNNLVVHPARFERTTSGTANQRSIQLSYGC